MQRFVADPAVQPCAVPDTYAQVAEYQACMIHNLLADYSAWWEKLHERGARLERFVVSPLPATSTPAAATVRVTGFPVGGDRHGFQWHLLQLAPRARAPFFCIVVAHESQDTAGTVWSPLPWGECPAAPAAGGTVEAVDCGFIGSYLQHCAALMNLSPTPVLAGVLDPRARGAGTYQAHGSRPGAAMPGPAYNPSQTACIAGMRHNIEVVQGPPGTGKSTTILCIIAERLWRDEVVGVVCSRNGAVDSIIEKLGQLQVENRTHVLAVGSPVRLGPHATRFTLAAQVEQHSTVGTRSDALERVAGAAVSVQKHLDSLRQSPRVLRAGTQLYGADFARRWAAHIDTLYAARVDFLRCLQGKVERDKRALAALRQKVAQRLVRKTRICVSTIAAVDQWPIRKIHTFIVDEAGCTTEQEMAVLVARRPVNLVLVGDDYQLPPFTHVDARLGARTRHNRSLFARAAAVLGRRCVHFLAKQYRMHPAICALVSRLFYAGRVQSAPGAAPLGVANVHPVVLVDVHGATVAGAGGSVYNTAEVDAVRHIVQRLQRAAAPGTIGVITFYRAQHSRLHTALQGQPGVALQTVDSVQGLEYDYVILYTVRTSATAFLQDAQRVNVAISRARRALVIVGHRGMLRKARLWKKIVPHARAMTPAQICA